MKIIKYSNRKYYFPTLKSYINLKEIGMMVRNNAEVEVIDYKTKHDITNKTLKQVLLKYSCNNDTLLHFIRIIN